MNGLNGDFDDRDHCDCSYGRKCSDCQSMVNRSTITGSISYGTNSDKVRVDPDNTFFDQPSGNILDPKIQKKIEKNIASRKAKATNVSNRKIRRDKVREDKRIENANLFIKHCTYPQDYKEEEGYGPLYFLIKFCFENSRTIRPILSLLEDLVKPNETLDQIVRLEDFVEAHKRNIIRKIQED